MLHVQVLNFVPKTAKLINVGKRCGDVKAMFQRWKITMVSWETRGKSPYIIGTHIGNPSINGPFSLAMLVY